MTTWVVPLESQSVEEILESKQVMVESDEAIDSEDVIVLYRPTETDLVGCFTVADATPVGADATTTLVTVTPQSETVGRLSVTRESEQERFTGDVLALDESEAEVKRRQLDRADDRLPPNTDASEQTGSLLDIESLSDIVRASAQVDAAQQDFSGERHGRLVLRNQILRGSDLSYTNLENSDFTDAELQDVDFRGANLTDVTFDGAHLQGADFRGANLSSASFDQDLTQCRFSGASLIEADLTGTTLEGADFSQAVLDDANLRGTRPHRTCFDDASLKDIHCQDAEFIDATFRGANLSESTLADADFTGATFDGAKLTNVDFTRPLIDETSFKSAELSKAEFDGVTAAGLDFTDANLTDASFTDAILEDARFTGSRLTRADFRGSNLSGAVMTDAKASEADFRHAVIERVAFGQTELFAATFGGAALYGAILQSARVGGDTSFHLNTHTESTSDAPTDTATEATHRRVVYDPRSNQSIPEGVAGDPADVEKAESVYQTLETVMAENAYGAVASSYFWNQKEMQRYQARQGGTSLGIPNDIRWWQNILERVSCGYGESFSHLFGWAFVLVCLLATVYPLFGLSHAEIGKLSYETVGGWAPVYGLQFSLSAFTGLGYGQFDVNQIGEMLATIETGLGVVFFALLIFVMTRKVTR
ncbi:pentapeptide repeat-containing protein [Halorubellus salinus]|uniref:pentapeptide repeat-containing protein n=1 Tax=Halorubellus salinus TaxID=755309 RepID=UPI001D0782BA|nr:pentapeptide repeat-containing protein [Halorubellus salinus]